MSGTNPVADLPHYNGWSSVPANLATATRLRELDLPRQPGPVAATVEGGDYRGKSNVYELYDIKTSPPTTATGKQLEAAAARRKFTECTECGAHPDTGLSQVTGRCDACLHIEQIRKAQAEAQRRRANIAHWAVQHLDDPNALVAWLDDHTPAPTRSRPKRNPVAHTLNLVTPRGEQVLRVTFRLSGFGPRTHGVPAGAASYEEAAEAVAALGERYFVTWDHSALWRLVHMSTGRSRGYLGSEGAEMDIRVLWWRGDVDPRRPQFPRAVISPGNADRLALLMRRMATDATHEATPEGEVMTDV